MQHKSIILRSTVLFAVLLVAGGSRGQASKPADAIASQPTSRAALPRPIALGDTVTVDAPIGGFHSESPSTGEIDLTWPKVPKARMYLVLRSEQPKLKVAWSPVILAQRETNEYDDNEVERGRTYYYAIVAMIEDGPPLLVASGKAASLIEDGPLIGKPIEEPTTKPGQ